MLTTEWNPCKGIVRNQVPDLPLSFCSAPAIPSAHWWQLWQPTRNPSHHSPGSFIHKVTWVANIGRAFCFLYKNPALFMHCVLPLPCLFPLPIHHGHPPKSIDNSKLISSNSCIIFHGMDIPWFIAIGHPYILNSYVQSFMDIWKHFRILTSSL